MKAVKAKVRVIYIDPNSEAAEMDWDAAYLVKEVVVDIEGKKAKLSGHDIYWNPDEPDVVEFVIYPNRGDRLYKSLPCLISDAWRESRGFTQKAQVTIIEPIRPIDVIPNPETTTREIDETEKEVELRVCID